MSADTRRRCEHCSTPLPFKLAGGRPARFCAGACRVAAHRRRRRELDVAAAQVAELDVAAAPPVPVELLDGARWVRWRSVERRGRATKLPVRLDGRSASSTDPSTWSTFEQVTASSTGDGVGVVLLDSDDVVCLDLDHVLDEHGEPTPAARWVLALLPRTWCEVSPSGDGLHVWGRSRRLTTGRRTTFEGVSVEAYPHGRYMTVTGQRFADAPLELADLDGVLDLLLG